MKTKTTDTIQPANFGSVSSGTLRTCDLLSAFAHELEWQVRRNGEFFSRPENFPLRDKFAAMIGEAQDAWQEDGETLTDEDNAAEMVDDLMSALSEYFAPAYSYFGAHVGDGSDFGFWTGDIEDIKDQVGFVSSREQDEPDASFRGEWLSISDHGNVTLYVREDNTTDAFARDGYVDREIWGVV